MNNCNYRLVWATRSDNGPCYSTDKFLFLNNYVIIITENTIKVKVESVIFANMASHEELAPIDYPGPRCAHLRARLTQVLSSVSQSQILLRPDECRGH